MDGRETTIIDLALYLRLRHRIYRPIETVPEGRHVLLYWPKGERGAGGIESATVFRDPTSVTGLGYWTHGGPNSGLDWDPRDNETPTRWMPLPEPPGEAGP